MPKDISTLEGVAFWRDSIRTEQKFLAMHSRKAAEANGGTSPAREFRLNPHALKPVAPPVGSAEKRRYSPEQLEARAANLATLRDSVRDAARPPQERSALPLRTSDECGWYARHALAAVITRPPLGATAHRRSEEVCYSERYAATMGTGPFSNKARSSVAGGGPPGAGATGGKK